MERGGSPAAAAPTGPRTSSAGTRPSYGTRCPGASARPEPSSRTGGADEGRPHRRGSPGCEGPAGGPTRLSRTAEPAL